MAAGYPWEIFVSACSGAAAVYVRPGAMETAERDFNLITQVAIIDFIRAGGCEKVTYIRTDDLETWRGDPPPPRVDSYSFYSGPKFGYLAFFQNPLTGQWVIKSFKRNDQFGGFFPFAGLFKGKA
jgi:hypothetical protein